MVKRNNGNPGAKNALVSQAVKRRKRAPRGKVPSRASLRCRGVSGEDPSVQFPNGMPVYRFSRHEYHRPICRMYGVDRKFKYKGFFFCTNCRIADESLTTKGMLRSTYRVNGKKHECEADHRCYAFPTDRGKVNHTLMKSIKDIGRSYLMNQRGMAKNVSSKTIAPAVINDSSNGTSFFFSKSKKELFNDVSKLEEKLSGKDDELVNMQNELVTRKMEAETAAAKFEVVTNELNYAVASLRSKEEEARELEEENKKLRELISQLQTTLSTLRGHLRLSQQQARRASHQFEPSEGERTESLVETLCNLLALATNTRNCNRERKAAAFADLLMDGSVMEGVLSDEIRKKFTQDMRTTVFSAPAVMRKMDECGFTLNYAALQAISDMERSVMGKFHRGLFPSTKTIQRKMEIVHAFGDHILPFTLGRFPEELGGGELAKFPQHLVLKALVKSHGLLEKAKCEKVGVGYAYDGTKIDSRNYLELSGFKVTDRDAKDPRTGRLLYGSGLQSSACSFPDTLGIAKDTKEVFELYKPRFVRIADEAARTGEPMLGTYVSANGETKSFKHVEATSEMDMKTVWMINGVGCAAKQGGDDVMFCSFCPLTNRDIARGTKNLCHKWCRQYQRESRPDWKCHHVDMVTDEHVSRCEEEVRDMISLHTFFADIDNIHPNCKINTDEDPTEDSCGPQHTKDPASIHFKYCEGSLAQKMQFLNAVRHDLSLRQIATDGCAREQIQRLRATMCQEYGLKKLQAAIKRGTIDREGAITLILNNPPCLLHLENRCGIKFVTTILQFGLTDALNGKLDSTREVGSQKSRLQAFESEVNKCFNQVLWGKPLNPAAWKLPTEKDKDGNTVLCTLSFDNTRAWLALENIDELLDICIPQESSRQAWKNCLSEYRSGMEIARSHSDLTDDNIVNFQHHIDEFYQAWVHLGLGKNGITNYIHLLGSGHIAEFLFKWRNLYAHSQQGWEALNSLVKSVYFRRTNQGGGRGRKSKLYAVARWCQRQMLWASGYTYEYMENEVKRNSWTVSDSFEKHAATLPEEDTFDDDMDGFI